MRAGRQRRRVRAGAAVRLAAAMLLVVLALPWAAAAQVPLQEARSRVEAAFLRNFARYVTWPPQAFADEHSAWRVCVLGEDHFGTALADTLRDRVEQGRPFDIRYADTPEALSGCHIVFVGVTGASQRRAVLSRLKDKPVLTVGSGADFLAEGGVIRLQPGERMEMSINLDQARAASLGIPTKLIEVSRDVVDNGVLRRLR